jgi:hypothetical protein
MVPKIQKEKKMATSPRLAEMLKLVRFAFHMTPKNTKTRLPTTLFTRADLRSQEKDLLEASLEAVWEDGRAAGLRSKSVKAAPVAQPPLEKLYTPPPAKESELERAMKTLLDPNISTTKALALLQAERTRRGIQG